MVNKLDSENIRQGYSNGFRESVLASYRNGTYETVMECAKAHAICESMLHLWIRTSNKTDAFLEARIELEQVKKELSKLKVENQILKKAAVFFVTQARQY